MTASVCAHTGLALGRITQTMLLLTAAHCTSACSALHDDVEGLSCRWCPGVCACSALHVAKVQLIGGAGCRAHKTHDCEVQHGQRKRCWERCLAPVHVPGFAGLCDRLSERLQRQPGALL